MKKKTLAIKNLRKKKLLLIGGGGYLGAKLAILSKKEFSVTVCQRHNFKEKGINFFKLDAKNFKDCEFKINNYDIVINLAAVLGNKKPYQNFENNVSLFLNTYLASIKNGIKNYFFISSNSVYESFVKNKYLEANIYSYNFYKMVCEVLGLNLSKKTAINFKIIRVANIYGPNMSEGFIYDLITKILTKKKVVININKKTSRNFTYIDDAASCIKFLIKKKNWKIINVTNSKKITLKEIVQKVNANIKKKILINDIRNENRRLFNTTKLKSLGWKDKISFDRGIKITLKKFNAK